MCSPCVLCGLTAAQCAQASALLAQDEFPTLGAPAAEALPNGAPYALPPQGFANGIPPSHPPMDRAAWDRPASGASYGKAGKPEPYSLQHCWQPCTSPLRDADMSCTDTVKLWCLPSWAVLYGCRTAMVCSVPLKSAGVTASVLQGHLQSTMAAALAPGALQARASAGQTQRP